MQCERHYQRCARACARVCVRHPHIRTAFIRARPVSLGSDELGTDILEDPQRAVSRAYCAQHALQRARKNCWFGEVLPPPFYTRL